MKIIFSTNSWKDYVSWQKEDRKRLKKINQLIKGIQRNPFHRIENPEPLKYDLSGFWSRLIEREHRFVCQAINNGLLIYSCKHHYNK